MPRCRMKWTYKVGKIVSADRRFAITPMPGEFHVVDLDRYDEKDTKTMTAAKRWACARAKK